MALAGLYALLATWQPAAASPPATSQPPASPTSALPTSPAPTLELTVYKTPQCGCCGEYVSYLASRGVRVKAVEVDEGELYALKERLGIPRSLWSCHTALLGRYFVEGHVPLEAIARLAAERPPIRGISLPGMPPGSPGMPGTKAGPLVVYAVGQDGSVSTYMET